MSSDALVEYAKQQIDYVKHITTLSTGAVLLLATFLERVFAHPAWQGLAVVSISAFLLSTVSAVVTHTMFVGNPHYFAAADMPKGWPRSLAMSGLVVMWISFLVAVIALGVFAIRNLA